jgi:hypothetical protein
MNDIQRTSSVRSVTQREPAETVKAKTTTENQQPSQVFHTKMYETAFYGAMTAAKLGRGTNPPAPAPQTPDLQSSGGGTETTYRVGDPTRPPIRHDNGFLQNPNNPNDPNPVATVEPSQADIDYYNDQLNQVRWAQRIDGLPIPFRDEDDEARRLNDGIAAYRHFLEGNGADRTFSYDKFVEEDPSGQTVLSNATTDLQRGVEDIYNQMIADDPSLKNQTITFDVTGGVITVGASERFPYPETEDWQKAIGGHPIWTSATVTVTPPSTPGGDPQFSMDMTLHAEDRYNFNPGQADIATGVPDATRGKLEQTGLAHQYTQYATLEREVTWTQGDISGSTESANPNDR